VFLAFVSSEAIPKIFRGYLRAFIDIELNSRVKAVQYKLADQKLQYRPSKCRPKPTALYKKTSPNFCDVFYIKFMVLDDFLLG